MKTNRTTSVLALWALLTGLTSCRPAASPGSAGRELRLAMQGDPKGFDPLHATEENGEFIRYLTGGVLVRVNRATDTVEPSLADSWKSVDGGRGITFHLRPGLKFSDGTPLTAKDVERTLATAFDPKQASPAGDPFRSAHGLPTVHAASDREITVRYTEPRPDLERLFDELVIAPAATGAAKPYPATAGAFHVAEYKTAAYVLLEKNPYFSPKPKLDKIRVEIQPNREIEMSRFASGELHLVNNVEPEAFERLKASMPAGARNLGPSLGSEFLWFNQSPTTHVPDWKRAWFRSAEFRHAVSASIHREDISRVVYKGYARPASGPFSPSNRFWFNAALQPLTYDAAAAARSLAAAGFVVRNGVLHDGAGHPVEFSLITNAGNKGRERTAAVIQDDLKKIGIKVNIVPLDFGSLVDRLTRSSDYEACLLGFANVDKDPVQQNNVWLSSGPTHAWWPQQKTPATPWEAEIDRLMLAQSGEMDRALRKKAFDRVQQIVREQEPIIYLVNRDFLAAVSPAVRGAAPVPVAPQLIWNAERLELAAAR